MRFGTLLLSALLLAAAPLAAQGNKSTYGPLGDHVIAGPAKNVDIITPHITDAHALELPFLGEVELPRWTPVHVGGLTIDLSPTKHVVMLLVAALLCLLIMIPAALSNERQTAHKGHAKGFAGAIESLVLFIRNEVVLPNVGHHGDAYVPFAMTLFFFILFANLLGLVPYGSTATGNISVTATLAILSFIVIEVAGMKALGKGYWKTIIYWPSDQHIAIKLPMTFIMTPIEIIGKFTKPFALAIRLFANMTAGHVVLLALISLIFTFGSFYVAAAPIAMGVAISMLELFVALLQAYIFTLLSSVFIGLIRESAH
ncbi:MAG TPA: F0F1 ATP synthase subunit A [Gemmatimonadaceae bacterium]